MDGISSTISRVFGSEYMILGDEDIEQGLQRPCFFISLVTSSTENKPSKRYLDQNVFDIHYFPRNARNNTEMFMVGDILKKELEVLELLNGTKLRGLNMHYEVGDGVLHFFVTYNAYSRASNTTETMDSYTWEGRTI